MPWNKLVTRSLDRLFGKGKWNFVTVANKEDSTVTQRPLPPILPYLCREFYIFKIQLLFGNFFMSN